MKTALTLLFTALLIFPAAAQMEVSLPQTSPELTFTLPENWKSFEKENSNITSHSVDGTFIFYIQKNFKEYNLERDMEIVMKRFFGRPLYDYKKYHDDAWLLDNGIRIKTVDAIAWMGQTGFTLTGAEITLTNGEEYLALAAGENAVYDEQGTDPVVSILFSLKETAAPAPVTE